VAVGEYRTVAGDYERPHVVVAGYRQGATEGVDVGVDGDGSGQHVGVADARGHPAVDEAPHRAPLGSQGRDLDGSDRYRLRLASGRSGYTGRNGAIDPQVHPALVPTLERNDGQRAFGREARWQPQSDAEQGATSNLREPDPGSLSLT